MNRFFKSFLSVMAVALTSWTWAANEYTVYPSLSTYTINSGTDYQALISPVLMPTEFATTPFSFDVTIDYTGGSQRTDIKKVELIDPATGVLVSVDDHEGGYTGGSDNLNVYALKNIDNVYAGKILLVKSYVKRNQNWNSSTIQILLSNGVNHTAYTVSGEVISLNFNAAEGLINEAVFAGLHPAKGWTNLNEQNGKASATIWTGSSVEQSTMFVEYSASGVHQYTTSIDDAFLKGYLDENTSSNPTITLNNIPFSQYSVIVYTATDTENATFRPVTIGEKSYKGSCTLTADVGYAEESTTSWGASRSATAIYGTNALRVDNLSDATLTIKGGSKNGSERGCIAAIQIVNTGTIRNKPTYEVTDEGGSWDINPVENDSVAVDFGATSEESAYLTVDGDLTFASMLTMGEYGGTLAKSDASKQWNAKYTTINTNTIVEAGAAILGVVSIAKDKTLTVSDAYGDIVSGVSNNGVLAFAGTESEPLQYASNDGSAMSWAKCVANQAGTYSFCGRVVVSGYSEGADEDSKDWLRFRKNSQTINIVDGANVTATRLITSDGSGAATTITQTGGIIKLEGTETACNNTKANAILLGHWSARTDYNLKSGSLLAVGGALNLGWDGEAYLTIGQETGGQALVSVKKLCTGNDGTERNRNASVTINPTGTLRIGELGIQLPSNKSFTLAGGTLQMSVNNAPIALAHTDGLRFTKDSVIDVAENATITYSGKVTGANKQLTKKGAGILNFVTASEIETLTYKVSAGTLILPAGAEGSSDAEGNVTSRVTIEGNGKLVLQLSEVQMASGYTAKVSQEQLANVTFRDTHGNPIEDGGANGTYTPQNVASWVDGEWDREITPGAILQINFGEVANQTCEIQLGDSASIEALKVSGSVAGKIEIVANAEVAIPVLVMDNTETVEVTANNPIKITDKISGNGALTVVSGEVKMTNTAVVATDYAGALTLKNGVKLTWGDNTNTGGATAGTDYCLGSSLTIETGAKLIPNVFTTGNRDKNKANKMVFATPVILAGGTIEHPDGSYYYTHITVTETSKIDVNYDKGLVIERLLGEASLTIEGKNTHYGCAFVSVYWTQDTNSDKPSYYCGTLTLQSSAYTGDDNGRYPKMVFYPDTAVAFNKAHIKFGNANVKYLLATNNGARVMGALSGAAADIVHGGNGTNPLTIGGYEGAIEPFSGSIDDGVVLNLNENASLKLTGSLGSGGAYSQAITLATGATLDLALAQSTTLSGVISGAGGLTVSSGTLTLTGANTYNGATTIAEGAKVIADSGSGSTWDFTNAQTDAEIEVLGDLVINSTSELYRGFNGSGTITINATDVLIGNTGDSGVSGLTNFRGHLVVNSSKTLKVRTWNSNAYTMEMASVTVNGDLKRDGGHNPAITLKTAKLAGSGAITTSNAERPLSLSLANNAIIDATKGAVTVANVTYNGEITVKVSDSNKKVLGTTTATLPTSYVIKQGETETALTTYLLKYDTDGVYAVEARLGEDVDTDDAATIKALKEVAAAAGVAEVSGVTVAKGSSIDAVALFDNVATIENGVITVKAYEFGVSNITVNAEKKLVVTAALEFDDDVAFAEGVMVNLYQVEGETLSQIKEVNVEIDEDKKAVTITSKATVEDLVALDTDTSKTLKLKVKVEKATSSDTGDTGEGDEEENEEPENP